MTNKISTAGRVVSGAKYGFKLNNKKPAPKKRRDTPRAKEKR